VIYQETAESQQMTTIIKTTDELKSPKERESIHGESDDDVLNGITPKAPDKTQKISDNQPLIQPNVTQPINQLNVNSNVPEISNQINYSANDQNNVNNENNNNNEINGQAEMKNEDDVPNQNEVPNQNNVQLNLTIDQIALLQSILQMGCLNPKDTCDTKSQAMDKVLATPKPKVFLKNDSEFGLVHNYKDTPYQPQQQQSNGSISEAMDEFYQGSNDSQSTHRLVIPSITRSGGTRLTSHINDLMNRTTHGNNDENSDRDDEKHGEDNSNRDNSQPRQNRGDDNQPRQNRNNGYGNGFGNGNGHGNGNPNGNGNQNDNNGHNNENNGNNQRQQPQNNDIMATTLAGIANTQSMLVQLLDKGNKKSYDKLPKCDIKFYGKQKDGTKCDLAKTAWMVKLWCNTKEIDGKQMYRIWMSDVLQEPAKSKIYTQAREITDFETLIQVLAIIYPVQSKLKSKLQEFYKFKYQKKTTIQQHLINYKVLCQEIEQERWIWRHICNQGRPLEMPTYEQQWKVLNKSIIHCQDLHEKTIDVVQTINPNIYDSNYVLHEKDLKTLTKAMQIAAKRLYPNNEMERYDITGRPRFAPPYSSGGGRRNVRTRRNRDSTGRGYRDARQTGKRNRRRKQDRKRLQWQNELQKRFKGRCYACDEAHPVRFCTNQEKKKAYCMENNLCHFCCGKDHKVSECELRKEWEKKKEAGNNGKYKRNRNRNRNGKPQKWNRKAIKFQTACKHKKNCNRKENCWYLHDGDYQITDDEEESEDSHHHECRSERLNYVNQKGDNKRKERIYAKDTLERVQMNKYKLNPDQVPDDEKITLYFKKSQDECVKHPALLDNGSTISAITPRIADKVMKQTGIKPTKVGAFMVENGSGNDVEFDGKHLLIPTLIPNTKEYVKIKYYIMPHNECAFGIILGLRDSRSLGYRYGLEVEYGKVLFKHRGDRRKNKLKRIEKANSIMDRIGNYPGHALGDSYLECYQQLDSVDEEKEVDSFEDSDDDSDSATDDSSDEDAKDGIPSGDDADYGMSRSH